MYILVDNVISDTYDIQTVEHTYADICKHST